MKIALIKETKSPVDNRVALAPEQVVLLNKQYPQHKIVVQASSIRAFSDSEYRAAGVEIVEDTSDCDVLVGIKEVDIKYLIPNKHYFFFAHVAKMQKYNRPLLQAAMQKRITLCDYEYLVDDQNERVCAFGWWAGIVGVYYTLRGYGLKYGLYELPQPRRDFSLQQLFENLNGISLPKRKVLITGTGRVSHGAQFVLETIGAKRMSENEFLDCSPVDTLSFCVANLESLVKRKDGAPFSHLGFVNNPSDYESDFLRWARKTDILISAHFWAPDAPVYLREDDCKKNIRIRMIGDITCDIKGSIKSTVRSSTHDDPFYDYNPFTEKEEPAFSSDDNITVMAVDTCPNALARETSAYFGDCLIEHVFTPILKGEPSEIINRSMIVKDGELTEKYNYLKDFASEGK